MGGRIKGILGTRKEQKQRRKKPLPTNLMRSWTGAHCCKFCRIYRIDQLKAIPGKIDKYICEKCVKGVDF